MRTYPIHHENGVKFAVEVENAYVTPSRLAAVIRHVPGVTDINVRKLFTGSAEALRTFRFRDNDYVVTEPFGDSSRYWIGPKESTVANDVSEIEQQLRAFKPSLLAKAFGDFLTLRWMNLFGR